MRRKIAAFIAFNAYGLCIFTAIMNALPNLFSLSLSVGIDWNNRFLFSLLLIITTTSFSATLSGAIAKKRGGVVTIISAVPLTVWWIVMFCVSIFIEHATVSAAFSLIAVLLTITVSYFCGNFGERKQKKHFPDTTVLGISPYHFIWIIIPLFPYVAITAISLSNLGNLFLHNWGEIEHIDHLFKIVFTLLPVFGLSCLSYIAYRILTGGVIRIRPEWVRGILAFCILTVGPVIINSLQYLK